MKLTAISQFRSNAYPKEVKLFFINNAKYEADCYQPIQFQPIRRSTSWADYIRE